MISQTAIMMRTQLTADRIIVGLVSTKICTKLAIMPSGHNKRQRYGWIASYILKNRVQADLLVWTAAFLRSMLLILVKIKFTLNDFDSADKFMTLASLDINISNTDSNYIT